MIRTTARGVTLGVLVAAAAGCASRSSPRDSCSVSCPPTLIETNALRSAMSRARARLYTDAALVLAIRVDEAGLPAEIIVDQSSGNERADMVTIEAFEQARFEPAMVDGRPAAAWLRLPVTLDDDAP